MVKECTRARSRRPALHRGRRGSVRSIVSQLAVCGLKVVRSLGRFGGCADRAGELRTRGCAAHGAVR
jgi:hypothetical protein